MAHAPKPQDNFEMIRTEYATPSSDVALRVERDACGHAVGLNGYTTLRDTEILVELLGVEPNAIVLDLGAGLARSPRGGSQRLPYRRVRQ